MSLQDTATAPVSRVASAALQALRLAADLLAEAAHTLGSDSRAEALREAVSSVCGCVSKIEDSERGVADIVVVASGIVQLSEVLASRHRRSSPAALACAKLAEAGAQLALEALTEDRVWSSVQVLSRRARQLVEIQELRRRVEAAVSTLDLNGVEGTLECRSVRSELRSAIESADPFVHRA